MTSWHPRRDDVGQLVPIHKPHAPSPLACGAILWRSGALCPAAMAFVKNPLKAKSHDRSLHTKRSAAWDAIKLCDGCIKVLH